MIYKQCKLISNDIVTMTWLPERFAILNKKLKLNDSNLLWTVSKIFGKMHEKDLIDPHIAIKNHRKNTMDNIPKF